MDVRRDEDAVGSDVRKRVQLGTAADPQRGPSVQEHGDVAAQACSYGGECFKWDTAAGEDRQRQQDGGGIGGASSQTGAHGNVLAEGEFEMTP